MIDEKINASRFNTAIPPPRDHYQSKERQKNALLNALSGASTINFNTNIHQLKVAVISFCEQIKNELTLYKYKSNKYGEAAVPRSPPNERALKTD